MFTGFSEDMIRFFLMLRVNNNREFFEANRDLYESAVRAPLLALAEALAPTVQAIDPKFDTRPGRAVSRIYRDVRFRRDKTPYRDYMWIGYRRLGETREETCGFYFDVSAEAAHWGCGYYHTEQGYMARLRARILAEPERVEGILHAPAFREQFAVLGDRYVRQHRPPEELPPAAQGLYTHKNVYAEHTLEDMTLLLDPALPERVAEGFRALEPFYWLLRECM
ncbi:MAG: DUF2461 domain-containing protein [Oscillospiraceae bacterium]|nr:DUF2461 domain-containing protein [Oscillospiraceae bacterium]